VVRLSPTDWTKLSSVAYLIYTCSVCLYLSLCLSVSLYVFHYTFCLPLLLFDMSFSLCFVFYSVLFDFIILSVSVSICFLFSLSVCALFCYFCMHEFLCAFYIGMCFSPCVILVCLPFFLC
jgi:hypothetical protein